MAKTAANEKKRITFNLSQKEFEDLERLADQRDRPVSYVLRQAIGTEVYLQNKTEEGAKILLEDEHGNIRELVFR